MIEETIRSTKNVGWELTVFTALISVIVLIAS